MNRACPACGESASHLAKHHWYEPPDMLYNEIYICRSCNNKLNHNQFPENESYKDIPQLNRHVMPSWDEQLKIIRGDDKFKPISYRNYIIDPDVCSDSDDIFYRITIGFEDLEKAKQCLDKWIDSGDIDEDFWSD